MYLSCRNVALLDRTVLYNLTGRVADPDTLGSAIILEARSAFRFAIESKIQAL